MRTVTIACLPLVALLACAPADTAGTGGEAGTSSSEGGNGGSTLPTGGSGGAGAGGAGAAGGAGNGEIYPLEVGHTWTWQYTQLDPQWYPCSADPPTSTVFDIVQWAGRDAYPLSYFCNPGGAPLHLSKSPDGGVDLHSSEYGWIPLVTGDPQEGYTWQAANATKTWHEEGTVTVPAGTFEGCWRAVLNVSFTFWVIYCPGVGPVHEYLSDNTGAGYDAKLVSKNF